jgi:hypothetical protein
MARKRRILRQHEAGRADASKARFFEVLSKTSNVSEAVRAAGLTSGRVYEMKQRDPEFARQWMEALEQGYCELEMLLLRHTLYGAEQVETVEETSSVDTDGNKNTLRVKTVRTYPHATALRLLTAHRGTVQAYRAAQGEEGDDDALRQDIYARIDALRRKASAAGNGH